LAQKLLVTGGEDWKAVNLPTTVRPLAIVTLKNRTLSPVAELFAACARETAKRAEA